MDAGPADGADALASQLEALEAPTAMGIETETEAYVDAEGEGIVWLDEDGKGEPGPDADADEGEGEGGEEGEDGMEGGAKTADPVDDHAVYTHTTHTGGSHAPSCWAAAARCAWLQPQL